MPPMHNPDRFAERRQQAAALLREGGIDLLLVGPSASFRYFTGRHTVSTERFAALLIRPDGTAAAFVPRLQAPLYEGAGLEVVVWDEEQAPLTLLADRLIAQSVRRIAINDELWSGFLLKLRMAAPHIELLPDAAITTRLRSRKQPDEIDALRAAAARIDTVWEKFCAAPEGLSGHTEFALRRRIDALMRAEGFTEIPWIDVGAGPNGASPLHHGSEHVVAPGEPVVFDFAGLYDSWYADICRVAVAGEADPAFLHLYDTLSEAQEAACQAVRPGMPAQEIDRVARRIITERGYGPYFTHRIGHGIGMAAHEDPYIVEGNPTPLVPGMVFSIEPGIYVPGRWGARIEDILVVTEDGAERLNTVPRTLACLR